MWTTFRKPLAEAAHYEPARVVVKAVTSAGGPEPRVPARGRDAAVSLWVDGMPGSASLADCSVWFGNREQLGCYLSPVAENGGCQLNARLPDGLTPGQYEVQLKVRSQPVADAHRVTVVEPPTHAPRVLSVTDGINLTSRYRVETGGAKVLIEDLPDPAGVSFTIAGRPAEFVQYECKDPITSTWEFAFHLAHKTARGRQLLNVRVDGCDLGTIELEVV
jgi:hypothetical protein